MQATVNTTETQVRTGHDRAGKYLVFSLDAEEFGVRVVKVQEIMGVLAITAVPQTPAYVKGVIDLRGKVIPVIDLRLKFGLPEIEYSARTCIIVVQMKQSSGTLLMGIVVDGVTEVLNLAESDIEDTPDFGHGVTTPYLLGMAKINGRVKILLDLEQALNTQELRSLSGMLA